jgi:carbonic anhydrase
MRLFEAIVDANHRAVSGDETAGLGLDDFADSLPLAALTCIDARLNPMLPEVLGIQEKDFIWLRNAGNIIFDPMSSMMRTLALACAVKGAKEIAIIGHTDCRVGKMSIVELIDRFKELGIDRSRLPENLNEFFGLFASERQNVMRGVEFIRSSPLIGPNMPTHGLLLDINSGRLEWLVNGYESSARSAAAIAGPEKTTMEKVLDALPSIPAFNIGEMKFPEMKIGEVVSIAENVLQKIRSGGELMGGSGSDASAARDQSAQSSAPAPSPQPFTINRLLRYIIIGEDKKKYGPISGAKVMEWLAEGRVHAQTLAQPDGRADWKPLVTFAETNQPPAIPMAPSIRLAAHPQRTKP